MWGSDFVHARYFENLLNIHRPLAESLAHAQNRAAEVRAELNRPFVHNRHPFAAMRFEQFRQKAAKGSPLAREVRVMRAILEVFYNMAK